jgi:hypothetical protein
MIVHEARVHPSAARLPHEAQLTWKIAELAAAAPPPEAAVADMVACRVVDNAGVALAAINRQPVATARVIALTEETFPRAFRSWQGLAKVLHDAIGCCAVAITT